MFDHVTIRVRDREASERFYDTVLAPLGHRHERLGPRVSRWGEFFVTQSDAEHPPTEGLHVGFCASSRDDVDAFWRAGVEAGYRSDGEPGPRPQYAPDYYGAFLFDPDGNSIEAVHHSGVHREGVIDHLWIRVPDLPAARAFYERLSEFTGFRFASERPDRVHFDGRGSSFGLVADSPPTRDLHIAFTAATNDQVDAFHAAALAAGYRDNGGPGERPRYHAGYYAAFVFDPAAANVELVNHNR
jgi:catechol 2,3-dioxygenase-like lactoylglutathione lyase family enzyme